MMKNVLANGKEYPFQELKVVEGEIPKGISGRYLRNGPGTLHYDKAILDHWFMGDGFIVMVSFEDGKCFSQARFAKTELKEDRDGSQSFESNVIAKIFRTLFSNPKAKNPVSTGVLPLKNSPKFMALCEAGDPFLMSKTTLQSQGYSTFGWLKSAFSAHPKVDPDNGHIFNFGIDWGETELHVMEATEKMEKVRENFIKLRNLQSIHDFCLAGKYLVVMEFPIDFEGKVALIKTFLKSLSFNDSKTTLIHIFRREDLSHVKTIETDPFFVFHYANGYSTQNRIYLQYCRYNCPEAKEVMEFVDHAPHFAVGSEREFRVFTHMEEMEINLDTFEVVCHPEDVCVEFPVCEGHETGKNWRYTYFTCNREKEKNGYMRSLAKFDRVQKSWTIKEVGGNAYVNEPALIRTGDDLYLMSIVNRNLRSFVEIFSSKDLSLVCSIELPEFIPAGFHGKWDVEL